MTDSGVLPADPVFVVCNARSGSTLLRYLLDVHPDIACPAETKIVPAARALLNVHNDLAGNPTTELLVRDHGVPQPTPASITASRDAIAGMVSQYLGRRGKTVWCDKSLDTVHSLDLISRLFPSARFICLHRHAMDVIASLLESCRWGYGYFDLQPYIARRYNNFPLALAEYWTVRTNLTLRLQQTTARTHAVHYEHLVRDPVGTLTGILKFLDLSHDEATVRTMTESALHVEHDPGAADWKIPFAGAVEQRSVERGRAVPEEMIKSPVREQMNALLAMLRYPVVDEIWNTSSDVGERVDESLLTATDGDGRVATLIDVLAPRLARYGGPIVRPLQLRVTHGAGARSEWIVDSAARTVGRSERNSDPPLRVTTRAEVLQALLVGGLPAQSAQRLRMLAVAGAADAAESRAVARLLTDLLTA